MLMHIPSLKSKTKKTSITTLEASPFLYMPLQAYKTPLKPLVNVGDLVLKNEKIAKSNGVFAGSLHSPVSGKIIAIETESEFPHIKIENDFLDTCIEINSTSVEHLTEEEILETIKNFGIEGSGGAKFPTHTKYNTQQKNISHFIINGAECEPYLSADYAVMQQETEALLKAIQLVQKVIKAEKITFGIEKQHKELQSHLLKNAKKLNISIQIKLLPNTYPQGGELQLIKAVTGKELPKGSIPAEHGITVSNVGTLWAIYEAFYNEQPYIERIITISGEKAINRGNFKVAIGTPVSHILEEIGLPWNTENQTVILGGPMMGKAIYQPETPINKGSGGVLILPNPTNKRYNCIQCGYCTDVCPQHLMPMEFARYNTEKNIQKLYEFNLNDCIECGACAYICPSDVPLMKSIVEGKNLLHNA
ncbi:electron transport complex protein RnfC [Pustulibacterium marinum]|uniref:Ion-translocating oxidoreductase complex subunit C n=1 Tax=Pustulibacterium marinum TaxID=1224947 RepID=A0A1I7G3Z3_9FLAO|nr:electron transport complex subunit RsxC [Pustulibacterium marinum]SFU43167.1 electron transport complex protein RnfC [Pustulibacterium marinum]